MKTRKSIFAVLTAATAAAVLSGSVNAVGPGFSNSYVRFEVSGDEMVTAVRTMEDFSWRGSMTAAAAVDGSSLENGIYYFHIEPVLDDDILGKFRKEYKYYKGMYLYDADLVDIDFWTEDGDSISPLATIYFMSNYVNMYNYVFVTEDGKFQEVEAQTLPDSLKVTPPHYSRFVLASFRLSPYDESQIDIEPEPEPDPGPTPKPDPDPDPVPDGSSKPDDEPSDISGSNDNSEVSVVSNATEDSSTPTDSTPSDITPSDITPSDTTSHDGSVSHSDKPSADPNQAKDISISAPDGPAATGDNGQSMVMLSVMGLTAGVTILFALRKKRT